MVSACHDLLCLVLQLTDSHPIGELDGVEVERFGRADLDLLLEHQVLVQRSPIRELDGCPVQWLGGRPFLFDLEGEHPPEEIDPRLLSSYEIDVIALCRALRRANGLDGPPVEALSDLAYFIGTHGTGNRRRSVCVARLLREDNAAEVVCIIRAQLGAGPLLVLTPRRVELRRRTLQHLAEGRVLVLPLIDTLDQAASDPFVLQPGALVRAVSSARSDGRLRVDTAGRSATLDGGEVSLGRLEFAVFSALAEEAAHENGFVPRDDLLRIIEAYRHNPDDLARPENLDNVLSRIRRALAEAVGIHPSKMTPLVATKRGLGHRLGLKRLGLEPSDVVIL
jgi:DNA-binding response OmpR family regulator